MSNGYINTKELLGMCVLQTVHCSIANSVQQQLGVYRVVRLAGMTGEIIQR